MGITQKQLAELAKVSMATVSLALNGSTVVAEKTREKILQLALKHNYQPNLVARSLAGGRSRLLGVLIDSRAPRVQFQLLGLIEREACQFGYRVMIGEAHDNIEHLAQMCQTLCQYGAEGIVCLAHDYPGQQEQLQNYFHDYRNLIFIGNPHLSNASYVDVDRAGAMAEAIHHLHDQGYKHIGMTCSAEGYQSDNAKVEAFLKVHHELGTSSPEKLIFHLDSPYAEELLSGTFLKRVKSGSLDALVANNDVESARIAKFLMGKGFKIPADFGLVGFDDEPFCEFTTPELSSINDGIQLQAKHAVRILLEMIAEKDTEQVKRTLTVHSNLVIRSSSLRKG